LGGRLDRGPTLCDVGTLNRVSTAISEVLDRLGRRIESWPRVIVAVAVVALGLIRNGLYIFQEEWSVRAAAIDALPVATSWDSWSWGNLALARLLPITDQNQWWFLHSVILLVLLFIPALSLRKWPRGAYELALISWALLPALGGVMLWIGRYDVLTLLGVVIVVVGRRPWTAVLGAAIMSSGNPPMAVVIALTFLVATFTSPLAGLRRQGLLALGTTVLGYVASRVIIQGDVPARESFQILEWDDWQTLVYGWPASAWVWYGVFWFVLLALFLVADRRDRLVGVVAFVVIPAAMVFLNRDWDRTWWLVSSAALLALVFAVIRELPPRAIRGLVVAGIAVLVILPSATGGLLFLVSLPGKFTGT
jgi:hypothetical protein